MKRSGTQEGKPPSQLIDAAALKALIRAAVTLNGGARKPAAKAKKSANAGTLAKSPPKAGARPGQARARPS